MCFKDVSCHYVGENNIPSASRVVFEKSLEIGVKSRVKQDRWHSDRWG